MAAGTLAPFKEMLQQRTIGSTAPNLTVPRFEYHTSRFIAGRVTARLSFAGVFLQHLQFLANTTIKIVPWLFPH